MSFGSFCLMVSWSHIVHPLVSWSLNPIKKLVDLLHLAKANFCHLRDISSTDRCMMVWMLSLNKKLGCDTEWRWKVQQNHLQLQMSGHFKTLQQSYSQSHLFMLPPIPPLWCIQETKSPGSPPPFRIPCLVSLVDPCVSWHITRVAQKSGCWLDHRSRKWGTKLVRPKVFLTEYIKHLSSSSR